MFHLHFHRIKPMTSTLDTIAYLKDLEEWLNEP